MTRHRSLNTSLAHYGINVVLDVGANTGQYGTALRALGFRGRIVSFEPQQAPFSQLAALAARDGNWQAVNLGLGDADGPRAINLYQDTTMGSMLTFSGDLNRFSASKLGTETIQVRTLDGIFEQYAGPADKVLLKIDTQGFEKPVLAGAARSLERIVGVQIELSITPLYTEQPRIEEMILCLRDKGFVLWQLIPGAILFDTGQELEVDGVFFRPSSQG